VEAERDYQLINVGSKHRLRLTLPLALAFGVGAPQEASEQEAMLGALKTVALTFCPCGWTEANDQLVTIVDNRALLSLYGTTYGGMGA
jgi:hypothetical protein